MISLSEYLQNDVFEALSPEDKERKLVHKEIKNIINTKYRVKKIEISDEKNEDGKYVVFVPKGECEYLGDDETLEDELFVWGDFGSTASFSINGKVKNLKSLKGGPTRVGWNYEIHGGNLASLDYIASEIGRKLLIDHVNVEYLLGAEDIEVKDISILGAPIHTLKGLPHGVKNLEIIDCNELVDFKGCPSIINGNLIIKKCTQLKNLKGCPSTIQGDFIVSACGIETLDEGPKNVGGEAQIRGCNDLGDIDINIKAKTYFIDNNTKRDAAIANQKAAAEAVKGAKISSAELAYKVNGTPVPFLTPDQFAQNLGFDNVDALLNSNHPILNQYIVTSYRNCISITQGSRAKKYYDDSFRIYTLPNLNGWEDSSTARKDAESNGIKDRSSSGAWNKYKYHVTAGKFKTEVPILLKKYNGKRSTGELQFRSIDSETVKEI